MLSKLLPKADEHPHIVIVGCGRVGALLASQLSQQGQHVVLIDRNPGAFDQLSASYSGYQIIGNAVELEVLHQAELERAKFFFATTSEDNTNLMVAQVAQKIFEVPYVVARVYDPKRKAIYARFGIQTINPIQLSMQAFINWMSENS